MKFGLKKWLSLGMILASIHSAVVLFLFYLFIAKENFDTLYFLAFLDLPIYSIIDILSRFTVQLFSVEFYWNYVLNFAYTFILGGMLCYLLGAFVQMILEGIFRTPDKLRVPKT